MPDRIYHCMVVGGRSDRHSGDYGSSAVLATDLEMRAWEARLAPSAAGMEARRFVIEHGDTVAAGDYVSYQVTVRVWKGDEQDPAGDYDCRLSLGLDERKPSRLSK